MIFIYYKCTCMNTNIHKYTNTQNCVRVCLCGNIYIQTYTFIPMNIYTQTYIHKGGSNPFTSIISFHHFLSEPPLPTETDPLPLSPPGPAELPPPPPCWDNLPSSPLFQSVSETLQYIFSLFNQRILIVRWMAIRMRNVVIKRRWENIR